ncbi:GNAT family N-acetyltransferase [Bacillus sp. FJAT-27445]|uniref:GNAT family N-acetyltransferase n=1 Tax=Bacillus sp. FJAT-27445 TaxID=1679166 RepID=UPI000743E959|nr:GNAT family N-acetyltransferase [Bacillus sp. FJAT-27445]
MINLVKVEKGGEETLHHLMQFYIYEFAALKPEITLQEDGTYKRFDLAPYWSDPHHHPFFIKHGEELIGFALVVTGDGLARHSIEEFHIIRKYNGFGYGKKAALQLFEMFPGKWRITQIEANAPAKAFWRKVIGQYTGGNYIELTDSSRRTIQEFEAVPSTLLK